MKKLLELLSSAEGKQKANERLLKRARTKAKHFREVAEREHKRQILLAEKSLSGSDAEKEHFLRKSNRAKYKAEKAHDKSIYWKGKIKQQLARLGHIKEKTIPQIEAEIEKYKKTHHTTVSGNHVTGGTARARLGLAIHTAALNYRLGLQPGYYSQSGLAPLYSHTIIRMPYGHRFDCSSFADGIYYCCGLPDPSGTDYHGGYTGTEGGNGKEVPISKAKTGDLVLYGPFPHHHVEIVDDPKKQTTIGHGSPPIDAGIFDLFGDGDFIIRSYV